jgi:CRISPR-associated protein Cas1
VGTLVIDKHDITLEYDTDCLLVRQPDAQLRSLPLCRVDKVVCLHNVQLTTQLLGQLAARGIDFVVLNQRYSKYSVALYADRYQSAQRRCLQYQWQTDAAIRLPLARQLCLHKFRAIGRVLASQPEHRLLAQLEMAIEATRQCQQEDSLRGIEGSLQRAVFQYWRSRLDPGWGFTQRQRRPAPDPVNALLSFGYTLVHHEAIRQAKCHGLDPDLGFYHRLAYSRSSLACDLIEPLRPKIEAWVVALLQQGALNKRHFSYSKTDGCLLGKEGRLIFYPLFEAFMQQGRRTLASHARWLARQLSRQLPPASHQDLAEAEPDAQR